MALKREIPSNVINNQVIVMFKNIYECNISTKKIDFALSVPHSSAI